MTQARTLEQLEDLILAAPAKQIIELTAEELELWTVYCNLKAPSSIRIEKKKEKEKPQKSITEVLVERGSRYGPFTGHARITQSLKQDMRCRTNWDSLTDSQQEALEMVAHKIGRILNGDPNYLDSWVDIVGYTQLVVDDLNNKLKREQNDGL